MKEILSKLVLSNLTEMISTLKHSLSLFVWNLIAMTGIHRGKNVPLKLELVGVILLPVPNHPKEMPGKSNMLKLLKN